MKIIRKIRKFIMTNTCKIFRDKGYSLLDISGNIERYPDCFTIASNLNHIFDTQVSTVIIDIRKSVFVTSKFFNMLVSFAKRTKENKVVIKVVTLPMSSSLSFFKLSGIDRVIELYTTPEAALATVIS